MKVAMYWHNGRSLGHTAEMAKISNVLTKEFSETYFAGISGAFKGLDMLPSRVDMFKLPSFSNYDRKSGWDYIGNQGLPVETLFNLRKELIYCYLKTYRPDVFMVNHIPAGLYNELFPGLKLCEKNLKILTLRGILFDKDKTEREYFIGDTAKLLINNYDSILVHIDPKVFSLEENYNIPIEIKRKIRYTGYLNFKCSLNKSEARDEIAIPQDEKIIVASMAGGQGAIDIWKKIVESLKENQEFFDKCYLITGPYLEYESKKILYEIEKEFRKICVLEYVSNMQTWMTAADLFIGAAGSSMLGEIISTSCNAIVIPRQVREIEQHVHAVELAKRGIVRMSSLEETLNGRLKKVVFEALNEPIDSEKHNLEINGLKKYPKLVQGLYKELKGYEGNW